LDFELARIAVLVKPDIRPADPDVTELETFMALSAASNGLFVSWTGFTDSAQKEAGRLFHQAKFWHVGQVAEMLKVNYHKLSNELKADLRLKQIWALQR
jgi:restriction system protein